MSRPFLLAVLVAAVACQNDQLVTAPPRVPSYHATVTMTPSTNKTGVYYMSGWAVDPNLTDANGVPRPTQWHLLARWDSTHTTTTFQDNFREPHWLTGFYDGGPHTFYDNSRQEAVDNNILGMYDAKFQFVTFQTGWTRSQDVVSIGVPFWTHAISRYLTSSYKTLLQWALLYDEEDNSHENLNRWWNRWNAGWRSADYKADFAAMVAYWRDNFVQDPQYLRIDGKPVIYILADLQSPHDSVFYRDLSFPTNTADMVTLLRQTMAASGLQVYLVGFAGDTVNNFARVDSLKMWGFDAITGYQYRGPNTNYYSDQAWANKDTLYRRFWTRIANRATIRGFSYFPPTTTGFDNSDLNEIGGFQSGVFEARSNVSQYEKQVAAVKSFVTANATVTRGYAMNCCWNEWTEGAYLDRASDISSYRGTDHADAHMRVYSGIAAGTNRAPIGWIDGIVDGHYTLSGWAFDQDDSSQGVSLDVYVDGCNQPSHYIGGGGTIYYHYYVDNTYNIVGNHGFRIPIPTQYRDGLQHTVCVYAFDTAGDPSKVALIGPGNYTFVAYP